jgi:hypothetical protein
MAQDAERDFLTVMLNGVMFSAITLNVVMLGVIMLSVVMLNVVASIFLRNLVPPFKK